MTNSKYNDNVFINCPFDGQYLNMFRACTFVILDAGFVPRCSLEVDNAMQFRLGGIIQIIQDCRYGVHDLSRVELDTQSKLPRFNMPFELGVFYAAKNFGSARQKRKHCIILEKQKYRYQKFISDIAGIDVTSHGNVQKMFILAIRNWLVTSSRRTTIPPGEEIYNRFKVFQSNIRRACRQRSVDYDSMPFVELVHNMTDWLRFKPSSARALVRTVKLGQLKVSGHKVFLATHSRVQPPQRLSKGFYRTTAIVLLGSLWPPAFLQE